MIDEKTVELVHMIQKIKKVSPDAYRHLVGLIRVIFKIIVTE